MLRAVLRPAALLTGLVVLATLLTASDAPAQPLRELRGVKLTNVDSDVLFSDEAIAEAMDYLAEVGVNVVLPVVWNSSGADGSMTLYPSTVMDTTFGRPIHPRFAGRDPLARVVIEAHRNGIEVLPWFEMGFSTSYSLDGGYILAQKPGWAALGVDGEPVVKNGFDWMSATHPEVQRFMRALAEEVVARYDVDGIEYSDRIPAMPIEAGYDAATLALYRAEHRGQDPPTDVRDAAWRTWRADRLTQFFRDVRADVKAHGDHLEVAASPSLYPWSLQAYLQDARTWMVEGIADHLIPQLYRYSIADYVFELDKSLANYPGLRDRYYAGLLVRLGTYLIDDDYLRAAVAANRARGVQGEVHFFYEGLRADGGRIGRLLRDELYAEPALVPGRPGVWRPRGLVIEDAAGEGAWTAETGRGSADAVQTSTDPDAAMPYVVDVPYAAWFDVYAYGAPQTGLAEAAYTVAGRDGEQRVVVDAADPAFAGWQPLATTYLETGPQTVATLARAAAGTAPLQADAVMLLLNRKRSPEVFVPVPTAADAPETVPATSALTAYPDPFRDAATVDVRLAQAGPVRLTAYDLLGRRLAVLLDGWQPAGVRRVRLDAAGLPAGPLLLTLEAGGWRTARLVTHLR